MTSSTDWEPQSK